MTAESKQAALDVLRRGAEMADNQGRPWWIKGLLRTAISTLKHDQYEELVTRLLELGYSWREPEAAELRTEVAALRKRLADLLREQREQRRRAGQQKAGKTKADPTTVLARAEELRSQGKQEQRIDEIIAEEFGVKGRTRREWRKKFWQ